MKRSRLQPISDKRARKLREAGPRRAQYRYEHPHCLRCQHLGQTVPAVHLHHIEGRWRADAESEWNYAMLCRACHDQFHAKANPSGPSVRTVKAQIIEAKRALGEWEDT